MFDESKEFKPNNINNAKKKVDRVEPEENIDDVLMDLDLGASGNNSKINSVSKEQKKEKDVDILKKRKQLLFIGGNKDEKDVDIPKQSKSLLDKSKREELNKETKEGNEVKKVNELKEKIKLSFDHEHQQDDDAFEDFELPSNANNNNNNNKIINTFTNNINKNNVKQFD